MGLEEGDMAFYIQRAGLCFVDSLFDEVIAGAF